MQWLAQDVEQLINLSQAPDNPYCPDVLVVGSGYGGAVAALRFAEHGQSVALLERGNEYLAGEFPTDLSQTGGFIRAELHANQGANAVGNEDALFDFRLGQRASALVGNGLGGGSLINAAVALRPDHGYSPTAPGRKRFVVPTWTKTSSAPALACRCRHQLPRPPAARACRNARPSTSACSKSAAPPPAPVPTRY